jgi:hypothetical protein
MDIRRGDDQVCRCEGMLIPDMYTMAHRPSYILRCETCNDAVSGKPEPEICDCENCPDMHRDNDHLSKYDFPHTPRFLALKE